MRDDESAAAPDERELFDLAFGFLHAVGELADHVKTLLRGASWQPAPLAARLGALASSWARLCAVSGVPLQTLLGRNKAHIEWRRAGRPAGGPAAAAAVITIDEYARWAAGTGAALAANSPDERTLADLCLGLAGEAGEFAEMLGRLLRDGDWQSERFAHELGDAAYYWVRLCVAAGVEPSNLLAQSDATFERS